MATYNGAGNAQTAYLGWDSVSNISGFVGKKRSNGFFLQLKWVGATPQNGTTLKYCIKYLGNSYITTNTSFQLPISYGTTTVDEKTGILVAVEECIEIETRYYHTVNTYTMGEIKKFCFCPPVDPFCSKSKKTKTKQKNISSKMRYSKAIKNKNGALGNVFNGCSSITHWNQLSLGLKLSKNDCYEKNKVLILPTQSD